MPICLFSRSLQSNAQYIHSPYSTTWYKWHVCVYVGNAVHGIFIPGHSEGSQIPPTRASLCQLLLPVVSGQLGLGEQPHRRLGGRRSLEAQLPLGRRQHRDGRQQRGLQRPPRHAASPASAPRLARTA